MIVKFIAFDHKQVHSYLVGHILSYILNGLPIVINLGLEFFSLKWFLLQECLDSILLLKQEEVVVVNFEGLSYNI